MSELEKTPYEVRMQVERRIAECKNTGGIELVLSHPQLAYLPESVRKLRQLERLTIIESSIQKLPSWISELSALRSLMWYGNCPKHIPDSLSKLRHLELLNLGGHQTITGLKVVSRLKNLQDLILQNMSLTEVSDTVRGLKRIHEMPALFGPEDSLVGESDL